MLDHLSNYPSPSPQCAKDEMFNSITNSQKYRYGIYENISKENIKNIISKVVDDMQPFGSEAAWYMCHIPDINSQTDKLVNKIFQRKRKLINYLLFVGKLICLWKNVVERKYHPDSLFVAECCQKYENVLKGNKNNYVYPPVPPD